MSVAFQDPNGRYVFMLKARFSGYATFQIEGTPGKDRKYVTDEVDFYLLTEDLPQPELVNDIPNLPWKLLKVTRVDWKPTKRDRFIQGTIDAIARARQTWRKWRNK